MGKTGFPEEFSNWDTAASQRPVPLANLLNIAVPT